MLWMPIRLIMMLHVRGVLRRRSSHQVAPQYDIVTQIIAYIIMVYYYVLLIWLRVVRTELWGRGRRHAEAVKRRLLRLLGRCLLLVAVLVHWMVKSELVGGELLMVLLNIVLLEYARDETLFDLWGEVLALVTMLFEGIGDELLWLLIVGHGAWLLKGLGIGWFGLGA